ncbi:hypothetical protein ACFFV7_09195 [Nonomuraea spiralis]|uniref:Secreted protein n=1 Tax=Nonomuraea spiralis TaxID=46182 RepID=A0ABV5IB71_9ACTN|nr:hypothetical protein [Nonomuraea spiralis]GGT05660.1 hypothetical protein GCM10010176_057450 [Nonomuraea spiralis]
MRGSLIATGGALLVAAAVFGMAGVAGADTWSDEKHWHPDNCSLGTNDDSTYLHVTRDGVFAGTRDADACEKKKDHHGFAPWESWGRDHDHKGHHDWSGSGNGNWIGHESGPGLGGGV